jgi:hypothetical protein
MGNLCSLGPPIDALTGNKTSTSACEKAEFKNPGPRVEDENFHVPRTQAKKPLNIIGSSLLIKLIVSTRDDAFSDTALRDSRSGRINSMLRHRVRRR